MSLASGNLAGFLVPQLLDAEGLENRSNSLSFFSFPQIVQPVGNVFFRGQMGKEGESLKNVGDAPLWRGEMNAALGIEKETRAFSPHLTLARGAGRSGAPHHRRGDRPNAAFQRLQEKLASLPTPEFGTMTAREFFLYQSQLSPKGSKYTKLSSVKLN